MREDCYLYGGNIPNTPVVFTDRCIGCNTCVNICRTDVLLPNSVPGRHPIIAFPDECWFCGCCVDDCPVEGASIFRHPVNQLIVWKNKKTGTLHRVID